MSVRPWRCLWRDLNSDPRFTTLPESAQLLFVRLIPELRDDGTLPEVSGLSVVAHIAALVHFTPKRIEADLKLLQARKLVLVEDGEFWMCGFEGRQLQNKEGANDNAQEEQESSDERKARQHRERSKKWRQAQKAKRDGSVTVPASPRDAKGDAGGDGSSVTPPVTSDALPSQTLPSEKSESEEDSEETKTTRNAREAAHASASRGDGSSVTGASRAVTQATPPDRWELQEILRKHAGSSFDVFVTGEGEKSLHAFVTHRHEQGADLRADFEVLGAWVASGQKFDDFAPPKSLQGALGKPTADGVRDGAGLQKSIATARAWASKQDRTAKKPKAAPAQKPVLEGEALKAHLAGRNPFAKPAPTPTPAAPEDAHGPTTAATR